MSHLRRAWRWLDRFCADGVNGVRATLGLRPLPLADARIVDQLARVERDYEQLVRDVARTQGHRASGVSDSFGGYLCACNLTSWSHAPEYGPLGGCPLGWPKARRAIKLHHDFGHRNDLDAPLGVDLCRKFGCGDR